MHQGAAIESVIVIRDRETRTPISPLQPGTCEQKLIVIKENQGDLHSSSSLLWKPRSITWSSTLPLSKSVPIKSRLRTVWDGARKIMDGLVTRLTISLFMEFSLTISVDW